MGRFAPPPFGGYVIEEEIIEEIEEDPTESGDSENAKQQETSVSEPKVSAEKANAPKERPAPPRAAPKPKPYKAFKAAVKPAPKNDYDKIHREKKTSKFILPLVALLIVAGLGGEYIIRLKTAYILRRYLRRKTERLPKNLLKTAR